MKSFNFRDNAPVIAQYVPPTDLSPGEVGVLQDGEFGQREITATLIDLTMRDFMVMRRVPGKKLFGSYDIYEFELQKDDPSLLDLKTHEKIVLDGLFGVISRLEMERIQASVTSPEAKINIKRYYADRSERPSFVGTRALSENIQQKMSDMDAEASLRVFEELRRKGFYKAPLALPATFGTAGVLVACLLFFIMTDSHNPITGLIIGLGALFGSAVLIWAVAVFTRNHSTALGRRAKKYIEGFTMYLKTAEIDRLAGTQSPTTIEQDGSAIVLYETYLPYAVALGLEKEWSVQFPSSDKESGFGVAVVSGVLLGVGALLSGSIKS